MDLTTILQEITNNLFIIFLLSIALQIVIAVLGVLPTYFITMANIYFFGVFGGFVVSVIGEAIGAVVSFYVYRAGFQKISQSLLDKNEKIKKIINADKKDAMKLIFAFRLFPYMPSGLVTYGAAIGKIDGLSFTIASTLGKIPSLVLEVLVSYVFVSAISEGGVTLLLAILGGVLIYFIVKKIIKKEEK